MVSKITLTAADGHAFEAFRADPPNAAKGGIVILHAIYGLTPHIGSVCDQFAADGYAAIAPALYDRSRRGSVFGYEGEQYRAAYAQRAHLKEVEVALDVDAAVAALRPAGKVAVLGFCTGGSWAWVMASRLDLDAAVIMYGSDLYTLQDRTPRCPTILHYGDADHVVSMPHVEAIHAAFPQCPLELYPGAGHAFYNPDQATYNAAAAQRARQRNLAFLAAHVATTT
jgi:carboxymethylenebutenolidase